MIHDSVAFLRDRVDEVIFDAEHFFDGWLRNPDYALACVAAAAEAGATLVCLCDTNGGTLPSQVGRAVDAAQGTMPGTPLGIHCHNDAELAVANSLRRCEHGCRPGAGHHERLRRALRQRQPVLDDPDPPAQAGLVVRHRRAARQPGRVSRLVYELANLEPSKRQAVRRRRAPSPTRAALHVVGGAEERGDLRAHRSRRWSATSSASSSPTSRGRSNLLAKAAEFGVDLPSATSRRVQRVCSQELKELEARRATSSRAADASLELLMRKALDGDRPRFFRLIGFRVIDEKRHEDEAPIAEATIMLEGPDGDDRAHGGAGERARSTRSTTRSARRSGSSIREIQDVRLLDYKVRVLGGGEGTGGRGARAHRVGRRARALEHGRRVAQRHRGELAGAGRQHGLQAPQAPAGGGPIGRVLVRIYLDPTPARRCGPRPARPCSTSWTRPPRTPPARIARAPARAASSRRPAARSPGRSAPAPRRSCSPAAPPRPTTWRCAASSPAAGPRRGLVVGTIEHASVLETARALARDGVAVTERRRVDTVGRMTPDDVVAALRRADGARERRPRQRRDRRRCTGGATIACALRSRGVAGAHRRGAGRSAACRSTWRRWASTSCRCRATSWAARRGVGALWVRPGTPLRPLAHRWAAGARAPCGHGAGGGDRRLRGGRGGRGRRADRAKRLAWPRCGTVSGMGCAPACPTSSLHGPADGPCLPNTLNVRLPWLRGREPARAARPRRGGGVARLGVRRRLARAVARAARDGPRRRVGARRTPPQPRTATRRPTRSTPCHRPAAAAGARRCAAGRRHEGRRRDERRRRQRGRRGPLRGGRATTWSASRCASPATAPGSCCSLDDFHDARAGRRSARHPALRVRLPRRLRARRRAPVRRRVPGGPDAEPVRAAATSTSSSTCSGGARASWVRAASPPATTRASRATRRRAAPPLRTATTRPRTRRYFLFGLDQAALARTLLPDRRPHQGRGAGRGARARPRRWPTSPRAWRCASSPTATRRRSSSAPPARAAAARPGGGRRDGRELGTPRRRPPLHGRPAARPRARRRPAALRARHRRRPPAR